MHAFDRSHLTGLLWRYQRILAAQLGHAADHPSALARVAQAAGSASALLVGLDPGLTALRTGLSRTKTVCLTFPGLV